MAWSYRQDRSDETYHEPGVRLVEGEKIPHTPVDAEHAKDMLDPSRVEKRAKEDAARKEKELKEKQVTPQEMEQRAKIRAEERARLEQEERDKELEKVRKEEAENAKKAFADSKKGEEKEVAAHKR